MDWFKEAALFERVVPGAVIKVRSRYATPHGGPADATKGEDPALGDRGEALVASEDDEGRFWVSYLTLKRDEAAEGGWRIECAYRKEHHEEFYCGEEFGELEALVMPRVGSIEPPEKNEAEKRAWFDAKMAVLRGKAREQAEEELVEEARRLRTGEAPYPPGESVLGAVLRELGAYDDVGREGATEGEAPP